MNKSGSFWFALVACALLLAGIVGTVLAWGWLHPDDPTTMSNSGTLRNAGLLIGGALAFVFAGWRAWVAEQQANAAKDQATHAQRQADTAQQSLLNERFQRGAEMLGSNILLTRMAGINALKHLAEEHPQQYHIQVFELFCIFLRDPTREGDGSEEPPPHWHPLRGDVQAVIAAICSRGEAGRKCETKNAWRLEIQSANFPEANFRGGELSGVNLRGANLIRANLEGANLSGADLTHARVVEAYLENAILIGADLTHANLEDTILARADLTRAKLGAANLQGVALSRTNLSGTNLSDEYSDDFIFQSPAQGLTQIQLDQALADLNNPPKLDNVLDAETGEPLIWRGRPLI